MIITVIVITITIVNVVITVISFVVVIITYVVIVIGFVNIVIVIITVIVIIIVIVVVILIVVSISIHARTSTHRTPDPLRVSPSGSGQLSIHRDISSALSCRRMHFPSGIDFSNRLHVQSCALESFLASVFNPIQVSHTQNRDCIKVPQLLLKIQGLRSDKVQQVVLDVTADDETGLERPSGILVALS